jgi:hypothetical protein
MEDITYKIINQELVLFLPIKNKGKFRWKTRLSNGEYGHGFATTTTLFTENAYLEWQVGYDAEVGHAKKTTILDQMVFESANEKQKNPYELSEILHLMNEANIINNNQLKKLLNQINQTNYSFDDAYQIQTSQSVSINILEFTFFKQDIILPSFSYSAGPRTPAIEISIQKQQYATGVQPMLYFSIPINNFTNFEDMIGRTSQQVPHAILKVNKVNYDLFLKMFLFFGMCSSNHKHDVKEILQLLIG